MSGQVDEGTIIDNTLCVTFADDRLHPLVKNVAWRGANGFESRDMSKQVGRQVLMHNQRPTVHTAVARHPREQPARRSSTSSVPQ